MVRNLIIAVAGFVLGAIAGYALVFFGTILAWEILGVRDRDGGGHMALGLVIAPIAGLIGGVAGAPLAIAYDMRRRRHAAVQNEGPKPLGGAQVFMLVGVVAGGVIGYQAGQLVFYMLARFGLIERGYTMWLASWLPLVLALAAATLGARAGKRFGGG